MREKKKNMKELNNEWIDQAELSEDCPCGSGASFGECCGSLFPCDCKSHLSARDCCYSEGTDEVKRIEKS
jgi:hypothetical protein